jgi:hypothetical protein
MNQRDGGYPSEARSFLYAPVMDPGDLLYAI